MSGSSDERPATPLLSASTPISQDDPAAISEMVAAYGAGADIVYGVRARRASDSWFKRVTGETYYRFAAAMGVRLVFNHADFRLLSRRAIEALGEYRERNLFLRGLIPQLGFKSAEVYYDRAERVAGESKYPVSKMLRVRRRRHHLVSAVPLKPIRCSGSWCPSPVSLTASWVVGGSSNDAVPGWTSTVVPVALLSEGFSCSVPESSGSTSPRCTSRPKRVRASRSRRLSSRLTIVRPGLPLPQPQHGEEVVAFDEFAASIKSGVVIAQFARYGESRMLVHRIESAGRPLPLGLALRWVTRGAVRIEDVRGHARAIDGTLVRWLMQAAAEPFKIDALLRRIEWTVKALEQETSRPKPALDLSKPPLYLRTDLSFGVRAGGSVGHIAGVVNELGAFAGAADPRHDRRCADRRRRRRAASGRSV